MQHSFPPAVQDWLSSWHAFDVQNPFWQTSPVAALQQSAVAEHAWPVAEHPPPPPPPLPLVQVPAVAPSGMSQVSPWQQSELAVHDAPEAWHGATHTCVVASQVSGEQQSAFDPHELPVGAHIAQLPVVVPGGVVQV